MLPSTQEDYSQWLKKNLVGCEVIYLWDNSVGKILRADECRDAYMIRFEDGLESEQPFHAFKLTESSSTLQEQKFKALTEANRIAEEKRAELERERLILEDEQRLIQIKRQMEYALKIEFNIEKLRLANLIDEAHRHLSNKAKTTGTPNTPMNYPFFQLKSPISTFQLDIEKYIRTTVRKSFPASL